MQPGRQVADIRHLPILSRARAWQQNGNTFCDFRDSQ